MEVVVRGGGFLWRQALLSTSSLALSTIPQSSSALKITDGVYTREMVNQFVCSKIRGLHAVTSRVPRALFWVSGCTCNLHCSPKLKKTSWQCFESLQILQGHRSGHCSLRLRTLMRTKFLLQVTAQTGFHCTGRN